MKKILSVLLLSIAVLSASAADYKHSVGINVGSTYGASYKGFIFGVDGLALQADLGVQLMTTSGSYKMTAKYDGNKVADVDGKLRNLPVFTFVANPNILYQSNIASWDFGSLDWYAGGGISLGLMKQLKTGFDAYADDEKKWYEIKDGNGYEAWAFADADGKANPVIGKFGVNAVAGLELGFSNVPLALSFDFRPGYGLGFYSGKNSQDSKVTENMTFNFFDWALNVGLRYCF